MLMVNRIFFKYRNTVWSNTSSGNINKISKFQRCACKSILSQDYTVSQEALERLHILSFDQIIFLNKSKKDRKDQEKIQSSTTPEPGYHMGK